MSDEAVKLARQVVVNDVRDTWSLTSLTLARAVLAQSEELQALRRAATGCPCRHTTPCSDTCSCAHPLMSAGCQRCASYGSEEQRRGAARRLAAQAEDLAKLRAEVAAYEREIDRIAHGNTIESDAMCVNEVEVVNLRGDNAKLRERFAASAEVREAITIAEALDENKRIRDIVTELVTKLEKGATISAGLCSWCRERWLHPADATPDDVRELSRVHAYRCKLSPLKLERDALQADVNQLRAALTEALDMAGELRCPGPFDDSALARIAELRRLADDE